MTKLHSYLNFAGNAEEAFDFYKSVFGGEFSSLVRFRDLPVEGVTIPKEDEDKIMHIALPIGEANILMASDVLESLGQQLVQGNNSMYPYTQPAGRRQTGYSALFPRGPRCPSPTRCGAITTGV
jgi:uncharacterized glyoxalase superfamily protein PhnB